MSGRWTNNGELYNDSIGNGEMPSWHTSFEPVTAGATYTFTVYHVTDAAKPAYPNLCFFDGSKNFMTRAVSAATQGIVTGGSKTWTIDAPTGAAYVSASLQDNTRVMLVEGTTPAAWAPADGESLAGGGAQMSANLWTIAPTRADGTYLASKTAGDLTSEVTGTASLATDQTVHMGASLRGAGAGALMPYVRYKDAAGKLNWTGFTKWQPTDSWQRFEGTCVVPSGMTIDEVGFNVSLATDDIEISSPVFCYGSPIVLARAEVTLVGLEYVEGATFEEYRKERSETDDALAQQVSGISETQSGLVESTSALTQRADGWDASVTRVEAIRNQLDGVAQVTSEVTDWARLDASDATEPALEIGTSASDFKERLSNRRLRFQYKGDDVLTLDGESSTVSAARVRVGAYEWRPTNGGKNLSLVYVGGDSQ